MMKKFNLARLQAKFADLESTTNGLNQVEADAVLNAFVEEVHDFFGREKDPAQRIRTLRFTRTELATAQKGLFNGAEKKCDCRVTC